ncbi:hypothetical protein [Amycolatopsis suaedae]|uniref:Uncharacterized protein n=1 Tax=Amycolatopsis suaedae TaxID=2510978 RepID=A0A4Q7J674_9PSEU|nr:hypothetical protein [Amycolatopsis suaedae]RZQ62252.1 hypothetical protein EWH70_18390 [Amycolatopsis suaedae]
MDRNVSDRTIFIIVVAIGCALGVLSAVVPEVNTILTILLTLAAVIGITVIVAGLIEINRMGVNPMRPTQDTTEQAAGGDDDDRPHHR